MAKNKVLFLITKATWGGAQKYVFDIATHLSSEEYDVSVTYGEPGRLSEMLAEQNIRTCRIPSLGRDVAIISDVTGFFRILVHLWKERPHVVHLNSSKAAALGALAARIALVPRIVFTVHGWPFKESRGRTWRTLVYIMSWFTAALSDVVVVVSKADDVLAHHMALVARKVVYIPIGIEPPELLTRAEARRHLKERGMVVDAGHAIVTIAELTRNKGIAVALDAVAALRTEGLDLSYTIIGNGELREALAERCSSLGLADRVRFVTDIPMGASQYLKAFDLFLLPSLKEGMPYVLLEASTAKLPIVCTTAVNPEFIRSFIDVHAVVPDDARALAGAIKEALTEKRERELFPSPSHPTLEEMITHTRVLYHD